MFWRKKKPTVSATEMTDENFNGIVTEATQPILVDFWAPWCGPCKIVGPIIDELAEEYEGRAIIAKVNVDQNPNLSAHFKIKSIPTIMFFYEGTLQERFHGLIPKPNLEEILEEYIAKGKVE